MSSLDELLNQTLFPDGPIIQPPMLDVELLMQDLDAQLESPFNQINASLDAYLGTLG